MILSVDNDLVSRNASSFNKFNGTAPSAFKYYFIFINYLWFSKKCKNKSEDVKLVEHEIQLIRFLLFFFFTTRLRGRMGIANFTLSFSAGNIFSCVFLHLFPLGLYHWINFGTLKSSILLMYSFHFPLHFSILSLMLYINFNDIILYSNLRFSSYPIPCSFCTRNNYVTFILLKIS